MSVPNVQAETRGNINGFADINTAHSGLCALNWHVLDCVPVGTETWQIVSDRSVKITSLSVTKECGHTVASASRSDSSPTDRVQGTQTRSRCTGRCLAGRVFITETHNIQLIWVPNSTDCLCGLVVRVPGYRCRGPGSIPGATRFSEIFWEVVGQERGPLSLVSTIEELLGRKSSRSGLEIREYGRRDPLHWSCDTLYPQELALASSTSGGRSVDIVRSRTQATEFDFSFLLNSTGRSRKLRSDTILSFCFQCAHSLSLWYCRILCLQRCFY
jgi:hypothetical protein